jgi:PAS domain S-box-containing protein
MAISRLIDVEALQQQAAELQQRVAELELTCAEQKAQLETARQEAAENYRTLVEEVPIGIYIAALDEFGSSLYINPHIETLLGFSAEEWLADPQLWYKQLHPDDRERVLAANDHCRMTRQPFFAEYRLLARDGRVVWIRDNAVVKEDVSNSALRLNGFMCDITSRKEAEAELQLRLEQLQALYHISNALNHASTLAGIFEEALSAIRLALKADRASILLFDDDGVSRFKAWRGISESYRRAVEGHTPWPRDAVDPQPVLVPNVSEAALDELGSVILNEGIRAVGFIPLVSRGQLLGKFMIYFNAPRQFGDDDMQLAKMIASHIAFALERREAEELIKQSAARTQALADFSDALAAAHLDYRTVLDTVTRRMAELIGDACVISLLSDDREWINPVAFYHPNPEAAEFIQTLLPGKPFRVGQGPASQVVTTGQPVLIPVAPQEQIRASVQRKYLPYLDRFGIHSLLIVPLIGQGRVVGTLGLSRDLPGRPYTLQDQTFLQNLADRVALAILTARLYEALLTERVQLESLSHQLVAVQETERRTIARELHDEIGQTLTGIRLLVDMAAHSPQTAQTNLAEAQTLVTQLIRDVQNLSLDLRPAMLDDLGLLPTLLWYFDRFTARTNITVHFAHHNLQRRFSAEAETAVYRLVQEALTNVARHSGAGEAAVEVYGSLNQLRVTVSDQGAGCDAAKVLADRNSIGLASMRERATLLGGRWSFDSAPGRGVRVTAEIPADGGAQ